MANTNENAFTLNREIINEWRDDGYDYNKALSNKEAKPVKTKTEIKENRESHTPDNWFNDTYATFSIVFLVLLVCAVFGYVIYKRFGTMQSRVDVDVMEEDTIYGIDFETNIKQMEEEGNYFQCIRLRYLELLRILHDGRKILWLPSKTVTQYTFEMPTKEFRDITNIFMKIRYGNYPASKELYAETCKLYDMVLAQKGGEEA